MKIVFSLIFSFVFFKSYAIDVTGSITSGGVTRTFVLHAPGTAVATNLPVMLVLHGDGGVSSPKNSTD